MAPLEASLSRVPFAGGLVTYARGGRQYVAFTSRNTSPAALGAVGRQVYVEACAGCHGPDGEKGSGRNVRTVGRRKSAADIASFILEPAGAMPKVFPAPRTAEDERDLEAVAAFVAAWPAASRGAK